MINNLLTENPKKSEKKFFCEKCDYKTSDKKDFNKHKTTRKHNELTIINNKKIKENNLFICANCDHKYNSRQGLWKHNKSGNCKKNDLIPVSAIMNLINKVTDQSILLQELIKEKSNTNTNCNNTTNNTNITNNISNNNCNNRFNIQVFLNEKCKDAINMSDFLETLKIEFEDLEYVGTNGYVDGITNIFMKNLKELDVYKRPIHCTDKKREVFYIKDQDVWEKDNEEQAKIKKIVGKVAHKNLCMVSPWQHSHPECQILDSKTYNLYMRLMKESLNGGGEEKSQRNDGRIIKNLANYVYIDKNN